MIKLNKQHLDFDKNYLVKIFTKILEIKGLELSLINEKIYGTFWLTKLKETNSFVYNIPKNMSIDFFLTNKNYDKF